MIGAAQALLRTAWGLHDVRLEPLPAGHANRSFIVHGTCVSYVARLSWPGKTDVQMERERKALALVRGRLGDIAVPVTVPTLEGADRARTQDGQWLHVFERMGGAPSPEVPPRRVSPAMRALGVLHAALARETVSEGDPLDWLTQRYRRVCAAPAPSVVSTPEMAYAETLREVGKQLARAPDWLAGPVQWLHGDFHAGNLLFAGSRVSGIVDFDDVGIGASWLEAAFAAFALSRDARDDTAFHFNTAHWQLAVNAYAKSMPGVDPTWWAQHCEALITLFCLDQVLIHLEASQRGLWEPGPGMGFLSCWRELMRQRVAS